MDDFSRRKRMYEEQFQRKLEDDKFTKALKENPHLAAAVEAQLFALGYVAERGKRVLDRIDDVEHAVLGNIMDGTGYVVKSPPKVAKTLIGGAFNLAEDIVFESINAIGPYDKVESYRQSLRRTRNKPSYSRSSRKPNRRLSRRY